MRPEIFASFVEHLDRMARDPLEKQANYADSRMIPMPAAPEGPPPFLVRELQGHLDAPPQKNPVEKALPALAAAGLGIGMLSGIPAIARAGLGPGVWAMLRRGAIGTGVGALPTVGYYGTKGVQDLMEARP